MNNPSKMFGSKSTAKTNGRRLPPSYSCETIASMGDLPFHIDYSPHLGELTGLLADVRRPGSFATSGEIVAPLPGLTITGIGRVAFPLLPAQANEIARVARQAPYGRGEQTLLDRQVRDAKQVEPGAFRLTGKTWPETLDRIVTEAALGLGCVDIPVEAQLYKLLLYEEGGFFAPHRDTEKTGGMFGTLVIALPSEHRGGELIVRHESGEVPIQLQAEEESELRYAAFYADCEHEVRPIESGHRLCLVYNLVRTGKKSKTPPQAPDYREQIDAAAEMLTAWKTLEDRSTKIAYLLEHEYTPEGLSFAGLKLQDAARSHVLVQAADRSGLAAHLGLVHLSESGLAEVYRGSGYGYRSSRYWDDDEDEDEEPDDYELVEAHDRTCTIGEWVGRDDARMNYGPIPLADDELLPAGALDDEKPDTIRVSEATGNEGGSYERFYHRAALILWPDRETEDVLLQAGPAAAVPHLAKLVAQPETGGDDPRAIERLAAKITPAWDLGDPDRRYFREDPAESAARVAMLRALNDHGSPKLIAAFVRRVVTERYTGAENEELCRAFSLCPVATVKTKLVPVWIAKHGPARFPELTEWFHQALAASLPPALLAVVTRELTAALPKLEPIPKKPRTPRGQTALRFTRSWRLPSDSTEDAVEKAASRRTNALLRWLLALQTLPRSKTARDQIVDALVDSAQRFPPGTVLFPVVKGLHEHGGLDPRDPSAPGWALWLHTAEFLANRSGKAPAEPRDWKLRQQQLTCSCEDCTRVMTFARDPAERVARLPLNKQRRQHLHQEIDRAELELTHETERRGSPYVLILTKTRWRHQARLTEYRADLERLAALAEMAQGSSLPTRVRECRERLREALASAAG